MSAAAYDDFAIKVGAFAAGLGLPVSYPAVGFTPPASGAWLEARWFPNATQNYGKSNDGPSLRQGFAQLGVCYRPGGGLGSGLELAGQIITAFGKGTAFAGASVYREPFVSSVIEDPERVMLPVTIYWRGFDRGG